MATDVVKQIRKASQGASPLEIPARRIEQWNSRHLVALGDLRSQEPGVRSQKRNPEWPSNMS
jgi:4'-phosphopantetheinyl transferase EntD